MNSAKHILFFMLVFIMMYLALKIYQTENSKILTDHPDLFIVILAGVATVFLLNIFTLANIGSKDVTDKIVVPVQDVKKQKNQNPNELSNGLEVDAMCGVGNGCGDPCAQPKENFTFELTPEKHCYGGPYMWSSDPQLKKFCNQFSEQDMSQYECPNGYVGAPVRWNFQPLSDGNWQNAQSCDSACKNMMPAVL